MDTDKVLALARITRQSHAANRQGMGCDTGYVSAGSG